MRYEKSCGAVIFRKDGDWNVLLIRHAKGRHVSFPKGHVESGETESQTAEREILEETGLRVRVDRRFRAENRYNIRPDIQKLAVISALIHAPKLILMDEPFVGLDPMASHTLKEIMRGICDNGGAIFFSTHVLEVAEKLCDKVAIIKNGRLIKSGTMEEVKGDDSLEEVFLELEEERDA